MSERSLLLSIKTFEAKIDEGQSAWILKYLMFVELVQDQFERFLFLFFFFWFFICWDFWVLSETETLLDTMPLTTFWQKSWPRDDKKLTIMSLTSSSTSWDGRQLLKSWITCACKKIEIGFSFKFTIAANFAGLSARTKASNNILQT